MKPVALVASVAVLSLSCRTSRFVATDELRKLSSAQPAELVDQSGATLSLIDKNEVFLMLRKDREIGGFFEWIRVQGDLFIGRKRGGESIIVPLAIIDHARITTPDPGKTTGWAAGISLIVAAGVALVVTVLVLGLANAYSHKG